ncbi:unnamed protein product, partial [Candidula unifasciata]
GFSKEVLFNQFFLKIMVTFWQLFYYLLLYCIEHNFLMPRCCHPLVRWSCTCCLQNALMAPFTV